MSMVDELNIQISADVGGASASISGVAQSLEDLGGSAGNAKGDMSDFVAVMSGIAQQMQQFTATIAQAVSGLTSFGGSTADLDRFAVASERASTSLTSMSDAAIYTSPRIGMMGTAAEQTRSELQGMQQGLQGALSDIKSFSDNLGNAGKDAADAAEKIKKLSEELPKLKTAPVTNLEAAFKKLKGTVAALGIGKFLKDSNDAYVVQMQNELKLTAHMKQRMNATDEEVAAIKRLASAQQKIGVIGDEIQLAGAQQLTTYAKQASTLQTLIPAMNDLIAQNAGYDASVGDATSAADMLGRALNGQYTALKRQGVMFTETQEQVLKYGTETQKAAVLAEAIGDKVGNMNALLANTPTGKLKQLQNDFGDLREQIGATFQPLISSIVPVLGGLMDALREPIINVSRGISIIGQAIASIDSPAVRGIALAAAGIAVLNKLRAAIGGPLTLLLTLGVTLAGLVGSTAEQTDDIGAIVKSAYDGATNATDGATDAAKDYEEELGNVQKAVSKLAGFDTITKLSGGSGALVNALVGTDGLAEIADFTEAAKGAASAVDDMLSQTPSMDFSGVDWSKLGDNLSSYLNSVDWNEVFRTVGNGLRDGLKYGLNIAKNMLKGIREWCETQDWKQHFLVIGNGLTDVFSEALGVVDVAFGTSFQKIYDDTVATFKGIGQHVAEHFDERKIKGQKAGEQYEAEHGTSAWLDFYKLYKSGVDPNQAFNQIFTTDDLKTAFFETMGNTAGGWVTEWKGLTKQDLEAALAPHLYAEDKRNELGKAFWEDLANPTTLLSGFTLLGPKMLNSLGQFSASATISGGVYDYLREGDWEQTPPTIIVDSNALSKLETQFPAPAVQPNNNFHDTAPRSTGIVPSEAQKYINVEVKNYINDEQVNSDYTTRTNG